MWLHDHNKGKIKIDVNTLEEVKEIESGHLNSYGGGFNIKNLPKQLCIGCNVKEWKGVDS
jgi:hypothetical protein